MIAIFMFTSPVLFPPVVVWSTIYFLINPEKFIQIIEVLKSIIL